MIDVSHGSNQYGVAEVIAVEQYFTWRLIFPGERRGLGAPRVRLLNQFLLFLHADWLAQNRDKVANENGYIS
jgi:hypothetical protein